MNALFADTFYWVALTDFTDSSHQKALPTVEVLAEYLTFFSAVSKPVRREAANNVIGILASSAVRVIPQTRGSFLAGLQLYRARPDRGYSLTDCISIQTMRSEGLTEALTNDRHFEQEGFRALIRI